MDAMRCLVWSAAMAAACCTAQAQVCIKSVRWYSDAPYAFRGADGQIRGLNIDIARATLKQMGCEANIQEFVAAFNTAFGAMLANGRYKEIAQHYLPCTVSVENLGCK